MNVLFIEYKVKENDVSKYVEQATDLCSHYENAEWLESAQQSRLYLEIWRFDTQEKLEQFSYERTKAIDSPWRQLDDYIEGGPQKQNVWIFKLHG